MITVTKFDDLGHFRNEWLNARHHFSFGEYHDANRMGVGALRVWNDDEVAPGRGFDPHPHRDMEIITYVREGAITHRDSLGNEGTTAAGDVQVMHAGRGIVHSEYNLESGPTRLFQIWLIPNQRGVAPGWAAREFPRASKTGAGKTGALPVLASGDAADVESGALPLYANGRVRAGTLEAGQSVTVPVAPGRAAYLVAARGAVTVNDTKVGTRDGATITGESSLAITATDAAEIVLVEVEQAG
jgi:redox-sensitive bicupin YhaK (pirin superfamily)